MLSRAGPTWRRPSEQRDEFLANLAPGERRKGVVSSVVNFGARRPGRHGRADPRVRAVLKHVDHPSSVVTVGDEVDVEVLEVDTDRERISLSLKVTQQDPWQEARLRPPGGRAWCTAGSPSWCRSVRSSRWARVVEGLVHISEMSQHHVDLPGGDPGEELWVKIIDLDLQRRCISLSIKQAAEGGIVAAEYQEHFGEHAYDDEGNYIGSGIEGEGPSEAEEAWTAYYAEQGDGAPPAAEPEAAAEVAVDDAAEASGSDEG
ncbi:MAG: S1 RNA-binding domain-containing protein [Microthrixaceae bacterium]